MSTSSGASDTEYDEVSDINDEEFEKKPDKMNKNINSWNTQTISKSMEKYTDSKILETKTLKRKNQKRYQKFESKLTKIKRIDKIYGNGTVINGNIVKRKRKSSDGYIKFKTPANNAECDDYWMITKHRAANTKGKPLKSRLKECEFSLQIMVSSDPMKDVELRTVLNDMIGISMKTLFKSDPKKAIEYYLEKFEDEAKDDYNPPEPPSTSSFYWINATGTKFKVSIPTENRQIYYNLEEYDASVENKDPPEDRWRYADKCLNLAVSEKFETDKLVIKKMEQLIQKIIVNEIDPNKMKRPATNSGSSRYYILYKYNVRDIINIPKEKRYEYSKINMRFTLSPEYDQHLINDINNAFQLIAERFDSDDKHKVKFYKRY